MGPQNERIQYWTRVSPWGVDLLEEGTLAYSDAFVK